MALFPFVQLSTLDFSTTLSKLTFQLYLSQLYLGDLKSFLSVHIYVRLMLTKTAVTVDVFCISTYLVKFLDLNYDCCGLKLVVCSFFLHW